MLIIFGPERGRRGAELMVMSTVENKSPGKFTRGVRDKESNERGFDTERIVFKDDELSYALGKEGTTRKKLEVAAGAILQYVGHVCFISRKKNTYPERKRCREFLKWLLDQRRGSVTIPDVSRRDDTTEMFIPENCKGWVTGNRGSELRRMEQETSVFMFMALDAKGEERLLIFGHDPGSKTSDKGRMAAERLVNELIQEKLRGDDDGGRGRSDSRTQRALPQPQPLAAPLALAASLAVAPAGPLGLAAAVGRRGASAACRDPSWGEGRSSG
ncbi:unnamed protein product, partial [Prorocentrum cordatum]